MRRRLFDVNELTGARTYWMYDPLEDTVTLETVEDVSAGIERNKAMLAMTDEKARWGEWSHVAWIPDTLLEQWIKDGTLEHEPGKRSFSFRNQRAALRKLDDPEFKYLRTRPGLVSR